MANMSQADLKQLLDDTKARAGQEKTRFTDGNVFREGSHAAQIAARNMPAVRETARLAAMLPENKSDPFFRDRLINDCKNGHENYLDWFSKVKSRYEQSYSFRHTLQSIGVFGL